MHEDDQARVGKPVLNPSERATAPVLSADREITAYEFLTDTLPAVVREDHRRLRMSSWSTPALLLDVDSRPPCGTICCIGGWSLFMLGHDPNGGDDKLMDAFGITQGQVDELCYPVSLMGNKPPQGSEKSALAAIAHMREFAERHAEQLKATILRPREAR